MRKINRKMQAEFNWTEGFQRAWEIDEAINGDEARLEAYLSEKIEILLRNNFEKLVQILYRIDYPERELPVAMNVPTLTETARRLAQGIILREKQKVETRKKYFSVTD